MTTTSENVIASAKAGDTANWMPTMELRFIEDQAGRAILHQHWYDFVSGEREWRRVPLFDHAGNKLTQR